MKTDQLTGLFFDFMKNVKKRHCKIDATDIIPIHTMSADWDPFDPANRERVFLSIWNESAGIWAAVEKDSTYVCTVATLLERLSLLPKVENRKLRVMSLGSGPGLYEMFLAYWFRANGINARIVSVDYAEAMISFQEQLFDSPDLQIGGSKLSSFRGDVSPFLGTMEDLSRFHGAADIVICNNSLQWVADWRKAVGEMAKCLNRDGLKAIIVVVHPHAMSINVAGRTIKREEVSEEALFDEFERHNVQPLFQRYIIGSPGTGQGGTDLARMFVDARLHPSGLRGTWRNMQKRSAGLRAVSL